MKYKAYCEKYGRRLGIYDIMLNGWKAALRWVDTPHFDQKFFDDIREFLTDFYSLDEDITMWIEYEKVDKIRLLYERRYKIWKSYKKACETSKTKNYEPTGI